MVGTVPNQRTCAQSKGHSHYPANCCRIEIGPHVARSFDFSRAARNPDSYVIFPQFLKICNEIKTFNNHYKGPMKSTLGLYLVQLASVCTYLPGVW